MRDEAIESYAEMSARNATHAINTIASIAKPSFSQGFSPSPHHRQAIAQVAKGCEKTEIISVLMRRNNQGVLSNVIRWAMPRPMLSTTPIALTDIAHTIQLALAPVFLLTGLGSFLNLLASRLARIVDHARRIEAAFTPVDHPRHAAQVSQLRLLDLRMRIVNTAIFLCTSSAVLICIVVAALFVSSLLGLGFARTMAAIFVLAMLVLIAGLILFLWEVRVAVRAIQISDELLERSRE